MTMQENLNKGHQGAKRSSWTRLHYRDLALKICEKHPDADVEKLAKLFLNELTRHPGYMDSIAIYIMANIKAALNPSRFVRGKTKAPMEQALVQRVVNRTAARVLLMTMQMPGGKTLAQSTGAECKKAGGWLTEVGKRVGDKGIVGEKLTEADLLKLFRE